MRSRAGTGAALGAAAALMALAWAALSASFAQEQPANVDTALIVSVDVSNSVDEHRYRLQMEGIAKGAELPLEDIMMINARTEVVAKARLERNAPEDEDPDDGCTGAVILPGRSATGQMIHGQNWDWKADCAETAIVLRVQREDGPDMLTFVEAGGLARCGMNSAGIVITANYLESERDFRQSGVPLAISSLMRSSTSARPSMTRQSTRCAAKKSSASDTERDSAAWL